jgi:hypothetical protein
MIALKKLLLEELRSVSKMFRVNYFALNFGDVGYDVFTDEKVKETIPAICKKLSEQLGETVFYRIIN